MAQVVLSPERDGGVQRLGPLGPGQGELPLAEQGADKGRSNFSTRFAPIPDRGQQTSPEPWELLPLKRMSSFAVLRRAGRSSAAREPSISVRATLKLPHASPNPLLSPAQLPSRAIRRTRARA
jgi:hypothetical protein